VLDNREMVRAAQDELAILRIALAQDQLALPDVAVTG
jgi:hypothetical protein